MSFLGYNNCTLPQSRIMEINELLGPDQDTVIGKFLHYLPPPVHSGLTQYVKLVSCLLRNSFLNNPKYLNALLKEQPFWMPKDYPFDNG